MTTMAQMTFNTDDPYAVRLLLSDGNDWTLSRELLMTGGGEGDVKIHMNEEFYVIFLMEQCGIVFKKAALDDFLVQCATVVPIGTEADYIDWTRELVHILPQE